MDAEQHPSKKASGRRGTDERYGDWDDTSKVPDDLKYLLETVVIDVKEAEMDI